MRWYILPLLLISLAATALSPARWMPPAYAQSEIESEADDPQFLEDQEKLDEDAARMLEAAEQTYRELMGEEADADPSNQDVSADDPADTQAVQSSHQHAQEAQEILRDAGCYAASIDGQWGPQSRKALADFARYAKIELHGEQPSAQLLLQLRQTYRGERLCPLACGQGREAKGNSCVQKTCAKGQRLDHNGICRTPSSKNVQSKKSTTPAACPAGTGRLSSGKCVPIRHGSLCFDGTTRMSKQECTNLYRSRNDERWRKIIGSKLLQTLIDCHCR